MLLILVLCVYSLGITSAKVSFSRKSSFYGYIQECNNQNLTIEASLGTQKWFSKSFPSGRYSISIPCMASTVKKKHIVVYVRSGYDAIIFEDDDWDSTRIYSTETNVTLSSCMNQASLPVFIKGPSLKGPVLISTEGIVCLFLLLIIGFTWICRPKQQVKIEMHENETADRERKEKERIKMIYQTKKGLHAFSCSESTAPEIEKIVKECQNVPAFNLRRLRQRK